jgi:AcrR family transcriptional regulator
MARKTKAEAALTRKRILKAALDLFAEKGYERTTLDDVARRIRLTKGAVYWHFKSKPELLTELVIHMTKLHAEGLGRSAAEPDSLEALREHFISRARFVIDVPENRKFFRMMTRLDWTAARFAPVKRRLHQVEDGIFAVIGRTLGHVKERGGVREDVDVGLVTAVMGGLWLGLLKVRTDQCLDTGLEEAVAAGFDMIAAAIRPGV